MTAVPPNLSKMTRVPPTTFKIPIIPPENTWDTPLSLKYLACAQVEGKSLSTKCDNLLSNYN
jgi:hypothetical protein